MDIQTKIVLKEEDLNKIVTDHLKRNGQKVTYFSLHGSCSHDWCKPNATVIVEPSEKLQKLKDISDSDET